MDFDHDFIIIGSGFGGSVSALRLAEKGYRVAVLEQGKRWKQDDFPKTNWNLRRFLWMPKLMLHGIQQISMLRHVIVFHGAGVGGGSLVYANTLLEPPDTFYRDPRWADLADWKAVLAPCYERAKRMRRANVGEGAVPNSVRSAPAQNARPAPRSTSTRASVSMASALNISNSSSRMRANERKA